MLHLYLPYQQLSTLSVGREKTFIQRLCKHQAQTKSVASSIHASSQTAQPLTIDDLIDYAAGGEKKESDFAFGTEHEKIGFKLPDGQRMNYEDVATVLSKVADRYSWEPILESGNIIGVKSGGESLTLEPGGQFELSGAPVKTVFQTCQEVNNHQYQAQAVAKELGISFLGLGFDPSKFYEEVPAMPKSRYKIMRDYMPKKGSLGRDMMFRSCTIQVNLDYSSEADMVQKFRTSVALQPIATAIFANSPFKEGKPTGFLSWRAHVWQDTDPDRCGNLPFIFQDDFGYKAYVDYALDVPMYFLYENGTYHDVSGLSFRDLLAGKLPGFEGRLPTISDWENHLSTIFPEVRLKRFLEMRGADGGPQPMVCALAAFWVGLLYDQQALKEATEMCADWTQAERDYLFVEVPKTAFKTPFRGGTVLDLAKKALSISREGLKRRGHDEEQFLKNLDEIVESGRTQADVLVDKFYNEWGESVQPVYSSKPFFMSPGSSV